MRMSSQPADSRLGGLNDRIRWNVKRDQRRRPDHRVGPDRDTAKHGRAGTDPYAVFDGDRSVVELEGFRVAVVTAGAQERVLGDAHIRADDDVFEVVQLGAGSDPGVVSDRELPRPL